MKRMMKVWLVALVVLTIFSACEQQQQAPVGDTDGKVVTIKGKVENPNRDKPIYFYELTDRKLLDSVKTDEEGNFTLSVRVKSKNYYGLNIYERQNPSFIIGDENLEIVAEGVKGGTFKITGSKDNDFLQEYWSLKKEFDDQSAKWQQRAYDNPSQDELATLMQEYQEYIVGYNQRVKDLVVKMDGSLAAITAASALDINSDIEFLEELAAKLMEKNPDSPMCKEFQEGIASLSRITLGKMAPDVALTDVKGNTVRISDLKGKYVLVDFWASWCGPCRRENPRVKLLYQKYGGKNFEILGISVDDAEHKWKRAIREDEIPWLQVIDKNKEASTLYSVSSIPFTVLLDREGKIIDKGLRGDALELRLAGLL